MSDLKIAKANKLIIIGDSAFSEIAYEYFSAGGEYEVVAFSVEKNFLKRKFLFGLPVVPFENIEKIYPPDEFHFFVAITYNKLNRVRTRLFKTSKAKGYTPASYISQNAFIWKNVSIGEHCFIFENNTLQPFSKVGSNVIMWSGNHLGHHSIIEDNCFISAQVIISGYCHLHENLFLGVNSSISNNLSIGKDSWIGPGVTVTKDVEENSILTTKTCNKSPISSLRFFKII